MKVEQLIEEIAAWLFERGDESTELRFGIWSFEDFPHTYYAVVDGKGDLLLGESSYGSNTIEEALQAVVNEISQYNATQTAEKLLA